MDDTTNPNTIKGISNSSLTLICLAFFSKIFPDFLASWLPDSFLKS